MSQTLRKIKMEKVIALTRELIKIPSENPPGNERAVAEFIAEKLSNIGFSVMSYDYKPRRPNVVGLLPGLEKKPILMFNGHTDTVPVGEKSLWTADPFGAEIRNGKIYGRGASDMKAALAAMISAAEAIVKAGVKLNGTLIISCVADEEVTGFGTKSLIDRGYRANFAVIGEPTELKVQIAHKGVLRVRITTKGKAAHASVPHKGINAIYKMSKACLALEKISSQLMTKRHSLLGSPTITVSTIKGGLAMNVVPDRCEITIDRRLIPGENPENVKFEIDELLSSLKKDDPQFQVESEIIHILEPSETSADELIVRVAREAVAQITGKDPGATGFPATCDMRFLVNQAKIPTIILGPGSLRQAHVVDEYVECQQVFDAAKIFALIILKLLCARRAPSSDCRCSNPPHHRLRSAHS
jgi:acetylornithine deacetylase/succinyl-diaminopimelate desuccinylase family protein